MTPPALDQSTEFSRLIRRYAMALGESEPPWLGALRRDAAARFERLGLPGRRDEAWKYNSLDDLEISSLRLPQPMDADSAFALAAAAGLIPDDGEGLLVLSWNGHLLPFSAEGLPDGVTVGRVSDHWDLARPLLEDSAARIQDGLAALGLALAGDGLLLHLAPGARLEAPVHVLHVATASPAPDLSPMSAPLILVDAGAGSRGTLIESHVSLGEQRHLTYQTAEMRLAASADIDHVRVLRENRTSWSLGRTHVDLSADGKYSRWDLHLGGKMTRHEIGLCHTGEGSAARLEGLLLGRDEQRHDVRALVEHGAPSCSTRELFKSILDDRAHGIFDGLIRVVRDAQQTDARQTNRNLLLSDDALVNSIPRLEIYADDVRCAHGSTTGALDEQQLFYLLSRGFDPDSARATLVYAFASEILDTIPSEPLRRRVMDEVFGALGGGWLEKEAA